MAVPERIGKYAISEVLGRGAMGVVYKGFDPHIHRPVAIKTIHKDLLGDTAAQDSIAARFRNEAQAVGRIAHPGVVAIYEFGEDADTAYIAMEFVEGRNLDQVLAGTPMLPEAQLLQIMDQLLDALAAAHAQGVWHRDIKPANLILTAGGQVKLTDFGIARIEHLGLTQVSSMIGTPGYMAPEQYTGEGIDQRADIFAAGMLLYRMLTGGPGFSGAAEVVMYKILNEPLPAPSLQAQGARPAVYDPIVALATAKRADARYPTAQAFRQALQDAARASQTALAAGDATVIVPPAHWARAVEAAAGAAPGPRSGALSTSGMAASAPPTGWDVQTLSRIERSLASFVGPMARLLVRDAARQCSDLASLASAVSQHIPQDRQRQQFLSAATGQTLLTTGIGTTPPTSPPLPATMLVDAPLSDAFKAQVAQVLTRHLGPIAKIVVKRAGERALDREQFIRQVLDTANGVDRRILEQELRALKSS